MIGCAREPNKLLGLGLERANCPRHGGREVLVGEHHKKGGGCWDGVPETSETLL